MVNSVFSCVLVNSNIHICFMDRWHHKSHFIWPHLSLTHFIWSEWNGCEATQFAMAASATNHSARSEVSWDQVRWGEVRWDEWYEISYRFFHAGNFSFKSHFRKSVSQFSVPWISFHDFHTHYINLYVCMYVYWTCSILQNTVVKVDLVQGHVQSACREVTWLNFHKGISKEKFPVKKGA